jgi:hypothetical protein
MVVAGECESLTELVARAADAFSSLPLSVVVDGEEMSMASGLGGGNFFGDEFIEAELLEIDALPGRFLQRSRSSFGVVDADDGGG